MWLYGTNDHVLNCGLLTIQNHYQKSTHSNMPTSHKLHSKFLSN